MGSKAADLPGEPDLDDILGDAAPGEQAPARPLDASPPPRLTVLDPSLLPRTGSQQVLDSGRPVPAELVTPAGTMQRSIPPPAMVLESPLSDPAVSAEEGWQAVPESGAEPVAEEGWQAVPESGAEPVAEEGWQAVPESG
ncbi:MAG: hypothetical protein HQL82_15685, partial [Magnetococcales bacterium]|nr:hypothetical protein [Magnetococcales bacterium]